MIRQHNNTKTYVPSGVRVSEPKRLRLRAITSGAAAIFTWIGFYLFVEWYKAGGFLLYWAGVLTLLAIFWVIAKVSPSANRAIGKGIANIISCVFDNYEENAEWVVWFLLFIFYGGILYFLFVAPYGILCHLGIKPCG